MNILQNDIYISDVKRVVDSLEHFSFPMSKTIFVTGSTGLICSSVIDVLFFLNKKKNLNWKIIAGARDIKKAHVRFAEYEKSACFSYFEYDYGWNICFKTNIGI